MSVDPKRILSLILFLIYLSPSGCVNSNSSADAKTSTQLKTLSVATTDATIQFSPTSNHLYRECDAGICTDSQLLFVFFPGSDGAPSDHTKIADVIGKTGIRVLVLAYQNNGSLQSICGTSDSCYSSARQDRVNGASSSSYVMSLSDGVSNRLLKALQTLGWTQFYSGSAITWSKIIVGGFSQGAGVAAWIGKNYSVARVCQFSGTWDHTVGTTSASWLSGASVTSSSLFYGFTHQNDSLSNGVSYLDINWQALGMGASSYQLYTTSMTGQKLYSNDTDAPCTANFHGCSSQDSATPINTDGSPRYADVWKYTCGR